MINIKNSQLYTGNVEVIAYKGSSEYQREVMHNTGTTALCAYIAECLRGSNVIANRPGYIVPLVYDSQGNPSEMFDYAIMYNAVSEVSENSDGSASYVLTFTIPSTILLGASSIQGLRLKGLNKVDYANVRLTTPIPVLAETNLKINWTLKVSYSIPVEEA